MPLPISESRRQLLVQMESILGNSCYNTNIQNYGAGGIRLHDGRAFRYPIIVRSADGVKIKISESAISSTVSNDILLSGYYAFGANHLNVMLAMDLILQ